MHTSYEIVELFFYAQVVDEHDKQNTLNLKRAQFLLKHKVYLNSFRFQISLEKSHLPKSIKVAPQLFFFCRPKSKVYYCPFCCFLVFLIHLVLSHNSFSSIYLLL